jgi:hypothetical protein
MSHGPIIATTVGIAVIVLELAGDSGMTEFLVSGWVGSAAEIKIATRGFDSIAVTVLLVLAELRWGCIPGAFDLVQLAHNRGRRGRDPITVAHQVGDSGVVATAEAFAIGVADFRGSTGIAEFVTIVDVGAAMVLEVAAGAFDAVVEAAALNVTKLARGSIPAVSVLRDAGGRRWRGHGKSSERCGAEKDGKCR